MLCLTLREGDVVVIGDARLIVNRIKGGTVRLALDVSEEVEVERLLAAEVEPDPEPIVEHVGARVLAASPPTWAATARRGGPRR